MLWIHIDFNTLVGMIGIGAEEPQAALVFPAQLDDGVVHEDDPGLPELQRIGMPQNCNLVT
jgi:hypothetical protein